MTEQNPLDRFHDEFCQNCDREKECDVERELNCIEAAKLYELRKVKWTERAKK